MLLLVQATVLTVGFTEKHQALTELPIRILKMQTAKQAAGSLKNENVDSVISKWELQDAPAGSFIEKLKSVKPDMPTIVVINSGDTQQEIAARSLGVAAVLTDDTDPKLFRRTIANVLGIKQLLEIRQLDAQKS